MILNQENRYIINNCNDTFESNLLELHISNLKLYRTIKNIFRKKTYKY